MTTTTATERRGRLRGLYAITPETDDLGRLAAAWCGAALDGGARLVQYRAKSLAARERSRQAQALARPVPRAAACPSS